LWNRFHVGAIGNQNLARVYVRAVQAKRRKRRRHNLARKHLSKGRNVIGCAWSQFSNSRNAAQKFIEPFEIAAQLRMEVGEQSCSQEFAGGVVMAFLQRAAEFEIRLTYARS